VNYLDRQLLAAVAPTIKSEFHLSNAQYGVVVSAFSLAYAVMAPVAGIVIDRYGLNLGVTCAVVLWSFAGIGTGFTQTLNGLFVCRTVLGIGESAGIPALGKANGIYLKAREFAMSLALNRAALTAGSVAAPLIMAVFAPRFGWRSAFVVSGAMGLGWVWLWSITAKRIPARIEKSAASPVPVITLLHDRRLWGLATGNALIMTVYTLWTNWTTVYFVQVFKMTEVDANTRFAWIPPIYAMAGAFFGGWLSFRWIRNDEAVLPARLRLCWLSAAMLLVTGAIPLFHSPGVVVTLIGLSFFWVLSLQNNVHVMPIDLWGPARAGLGLSVIALSYGLMQSIVSPVIGLMVDRFGFSNVCFGLAALPILGTAIIHTSLVGERTT
jgi:ACS family hexuronate transporter-like MFS transporter